MAERKTQENNASVRVFLESVKNETRRKDALAVLKIMESVTGKRAKMWGPSIVGCGKHHYKYASGREGDICSVGFAPRVGSLVFYLGNFKGRAKMLKEIGKHRVGPGGCIYINKLADVDVQILQKMIGEAFRHAEAG